MTTTYFAKFNDEGLPEGFIPSFHVNNYGGKNKLTSDGYIEIPLEEYNYYIGNMSNEAYRMVFGETEGLQTISEKGAGYIYLDGLGWEKPKYFEAPYLDYKKFNFIEEIKKYN